MFLLCLPIHVCLLDVCSHHSGWNTLRYLTLKATFRFLFRPQLPSSLGTTSPELLLSRTAFAKASLFEIFSRHWETEISPQEATLISSDTLRPSTDTMDVTSLLSLPREIRVEIFRYLLLLSRNRRESRWPAYKAVSIKKIDGLRKGKLFSHTRETLAASHLLLEERNTFDVSYSLRPGTAILRVNRLFLMEGSRILYRENGFMAIRSCHAYKYRHSYEGLYFPRKLLLDKDRTIGRSRFTHTPQAPGNVTRLTPYSVEAFVTFNITQTWNGIPANVHAGAWRTYLAPLAEQANLTRFLWRGLVGSGVIYSRAGYKLDVHLRSPLPLPKIFGDAQPINLTTQWSFLSWFSNDLGSVTCGPVGETMDFDGDDQNHSDSAIHMSQNHPLLMIAKSLEESLLSIRDSIQREAWQQVDHQCRLLVSQAGDVFHTARRHSMPTTVAILDRIACYASVALHVLAQVHSNGRTAKSMGSTDKESSILFAIECLALAIRLPSPVLQREWIWRIQFQIAALWACLGYVCKAWEAIYAAFEILCPGTLTAEGRSQWQRRAKKQLHVKWQDMRQILVLDQMEKGLEQPRSWKDLSGASEAVRTFFAQLHNSHAKCIVVGGLIKRDMAVNGHVDLR